MELEHSNHRFEMWVEPASTICGVILRRFYVQQYMSNLLPKLGQNQDSAVFRSTVTAIINLVVIKPYIRSNVLSLSFLIDASDVTSITLISACIFLTENINQ